MADNYSLAIERISKMGFTPGQLNFIFYDWPNQDEHISWLLTADRSEIVNWGEAANWGRPEYCMVPNAESCHACSLSSYGLDCQNNPIV